MINMINENEIRISVVIPTYNSWVTLKDCISSIQKQTLSPYEIIIVDNASSDSTSENVKAKFPKCKLITLCKNTGVTGGRNKGIENCSSKTDYILFFDHDMIANKKMLEELVKTSNLDNQIGIVTPKIYYSNDKKRIWSAGTSINLWTGQVLFRGGEDVGQYDNIEEVQVAPAAMLVKKEVLDKVEGFDERYFATYEDTDFCFRVRISGFKIFYAPKALAYHIIPSDPNNEAVRLLSRAYWVGRNKVIFMKDYSKNFIIFLFFIPIFTMYYLNLAIKYKKITSWFQFIRGTLEGVFS